MTAVACRTFSNATTELREMAAWFRDVAARAQLDPDVVWKAELCLNEATTNIVTHAYDDVGRHIVRLEVEPVPDFVKITIVDDGRPFNPLEAPPPPVVETLEDAPIGGLGIHLIRSLARDVSYRREDQSNVLVLSFATP